MLGTSFIGSDELGPQKRALGIPEDASAMFVPLGNAVVVVALDGDGVVTGAMHPGITETPALAARVFRALADHLIDKARGLEQRPGT